MTDRPIIFSGPMVQALLAGRKTQTRRIIRFPQWAAGCFTDPLKIEVETGDDAGHDPEVICEATGCLSRLTLPYAVGDRLWVREACRAEELSRPQTSRAATRIERQSLGRTTMIVCDDLDGADGVRYLADDTWIKINNTATAADAWSKLYHYAAPTQFVASEPCGKPAPSIHMPRWASRLTLVVTDVRVQRLQDIGEDDAKDEGLCCLSKDGGRVYKWGIPDKDGFPGKDDDGWPWQMWCVGHRPAFAGLWNSFHGPDAWAANPWVAAISFDVIRANIDAEPAID